MQLQTGVHTAQTKRNPQTRALSIGIVVALHIAALYAILNGIVPGIIHTGGDPVLIPPPQVTAPKPPPPQQGTFVDPKTPAAHMPDWQTAPDNDGGGIIRRLDGDRGGIDPNPSTPAQAIGGTHTIPPYPLMAIRLSEQGTVTLKLAIAADGSVSEASVQTSSGSDRLDAAAIAWVKAHWRYKPATRDGAPIASTTLAAVKFDLRTAR